MILATKDVITGNSLTTKSYTEDMIGFEIHNDGAAALTFTIGNLTISVHAGESYRNKFKPYRDVTITATDTFRAYVRKKLIKGQVVAVAGVSLNQSTLAVNQNATFQLMATLSPANATNQGVTWTSADPSIVTVDSTGLVTGVAIGGTTITVTTVDGGFTATCTVDVNAVADTTPPNPVTNLVAGTVTSTSIPLTWTLSNSSDVANYEVAYSTDGTNFIVASAVVNASSTSYTVNGLAAGTNYTLRVVAIDGAGNRSTDTIIAVATNAAAVAQKLYLSGENYSKVSTPVFAYDQVIIDFMPLAFTTTEVPGIIFQVNTLGGSSVQYNTGNDAFYGCTVYDENGIQQTSGTDFISSGVRKTLDIRLSPADTSYGAYFFLKYGYGSNPVQGYIYDIKLYNAGTLMAHYDLTTGTAIDQSGNGRNAVVVGGTWLADSDSPTDVYPPYEITSPAITNLTNTSFTISWTRSKSQDIASYKLYQDGALIGTISHPTTTYNITNLTAASTYNFTITSVDSNNNESTGYSFVLTTNGSTRTDAIPPITSNMVYNLDLTNRKGAIYSTVLDSVGSILNTIPWAFGQQRGYYPSYTNANNVDTGWVDNKGVKLFGSMTPSAGGVGANTKSSSLSTMDVSQGLTIETGYCLTNVAQSLFSIAGTGGMQGNISFTSYSNFIYYNSTGMEIDTLTVTQAATTAGNITITLNGAATIVTVAAGDATGTIGDKIRATTFTGWTVGGTAGSAIVTFTKNTSGANAAPIFGGGSTGVLATFAVTVAGGTAGAQKQYWINTSAAGMGGTPLTNMVDGVTKKTYETLLILGDLNCTAFRLQPDGTVSIMLNEYMLTTKIPDFQSWPNWFAVDNIYWGCGTLNTVSFARVYNRALTDDELKQNYDFQQQHIPLQAVNVAPSSVTLNPGDNQLLSVNTVSTYYQDKVTSTFESGNTGMVTVDANGMLTGVANGQTNVQVTTTYNSQSFTNLVNVTIGAQQSTPPPPTRTLEGLAINRKRETIEVGENFACMAYTLPFDIYYDNVITWESSDPLICTVSNGVLEGKSPGTATITCRDISQLYAQSFTVTVVPASVDTITAAETYNVVLTDYGIMSDNTNSTATTNGIIAALSYASTNGYKKIVFPNGTYLVTPTVSSTPTAGVVIFPTNMVIDFSDSVINIEPSSLTATGYTMFYMDQVDNCKLINTHVFGEADSTTISGSVENCISLIIRDAYKSGLDNCTFSKSPGFNVSTGTTQVKNGTNYAMVPYTSLEPGNIDDTGVNDDTTVTYHFRSNIFYDVSGLGTYYFLGWTLGYWGYPYLRSRLYSIYFYDANYNFITVHKYNRQFYNYDTPANAKYAKIVIYQDTVPTSGNSDFNGAVAFIKTLGMPRDCFILNSKFEYNYSTGIAMCGGQNWRIQGNYFSHNAGRMPGCDMDWEDGWESMVGDIVRNNEYHSALSISTACSENLSIFNNQFYDSYINIWNRTQSWRIFNNTFNGKGGGGISNVHVGTQEDSYFARNVFSNGISYNTAQDLMHPTALYSVHFDANTLV